MKTLGLLLVVLLSVLGVSWCSGSPIEAGAEKAWTRIMGSKDGIRSRSRRSPLAIFAGVLPIFSLLGNAFTNRQPGNNNNADIKQSMDSVHQKLSELSKTVHKFTTKLSDLETTMDSEFSELKDKLDNTQETCRELKGLIEHTSMWHKQVAIFGRDVQRLQYLLMMLNERLERDDLGQVKVNAEALDWASAVLSKRDDGVDQILMNMDHMITGKSPVFLAASIVKLYFKGLKVSDSERWVKMESFTEMLQSMEAAGYVVWATALSITNQTEKINSTVLPLAEERLNRQTEDVFSLYQARLWEWPAGTYGLMKVKDQDCPDSRWQFGWRQHDIADGSSIGRRKGWLWQSPLRGTQRHSRTIHMSGKYDDHMKWEFCMKTSTVHDEDFDWPPGTYCLLSKNGVTKNFHQGWIFWDDDYHNTIGGTLPDGLYIDMSIKASTKLYFSCRHDKPADEPIQLPTQQPFMLFPLHSYIQDLPCQKVIGMAATEEWYQWTHNVNKEGNGNQFEWPHPKKSGPRDQITLHFCYYEPTV